MKIKKLGHCCLIVEVNGKRIMTDPGSFTIGEQAKETNIDLILITHEHGDHLHIDSLKKVLVNNTNAVIITNAGVGKLLDEVGIKYEVLINKVSKDFFGVEIEACDYKHEEIFKSFKLVQNTGYFINRKLFYPGDSFQNPLKTVEILALPVAGPWVSIKDAINFALEIKPKICFPVHDGMIKKDKTGSMYGVSNLILSENNIKFKILEDGQEEEF
ncbi:MAG: MBL fold metallo-hydrolase [bacterium]